MRFVEVFLMLLRRNHDRAKMILSASFAVLAFAFLAIDARAGDKAPSAGPRDARVINAPAQKGEALGAVEDTVARSVARKIGIAADPGPPADFVLATRPAVEPDYIPVGRKEFEHSDKVKTPAELKAMQAEFEAVKTHHDALRSTFAPARKAVAEANAAKAAKAKKPRQAPAIVQ
jgi:hypothetical protein